LEIWFNRAPKLKTILTQVVELRTVLITMTGTHTVELRTRKKIPTRIILIIMTKKTIRGEKTILSHSGNLLHGESGS